MGQDRTLMMTQTTQSAQTRVHTMHQLAPIDVAHNYPRAVPPAIQVLEDLYRANVIKVLEAASGRGSYQPDETINF